jgi:hypothetical protein
VASAYSFSSRLAWRWNRLVSITAERLRKRFLFYLLVLIVFGLSISQTLEQGRNLPVPQSAESHLQPKVSTPGGVAGVEPSASLLENHRENFQDSLPRLFVQLIVIVMMARLFGMFAARIRQTLAATAYLRFSFSSN